MNWIVPAVYWCALYGGVFFGLIFVANVLEHAWWMWTHRRRK